MDSTSIIIYWIRIGSELLQRIMYRILLGPNKTDLYIHFNNCRKLSVMEKNVVRYYVNIHFEIIIIHLNVTK